MDKITSFLIAFGVGEAIATILFFLVRKKLANNKQKAGFAILKGILERFMLVFGLAIGIQAIITLFGAIKIGTRLKDANQDKISNDYFLIGNFISVSLALGQYLFYLFLMGSI
jgi:hypothetical protein